MAERRRSDIGDPENNEILLTRNRPRTLSVPSTSSFSAIASTSVSPRNPKQSSTRKSPSKFTAAIASPSRHTSRKKQKHRHGPSTAAIAGPSRPSPRIIQEQFQRPSPKSMTPIAGLSRQSPRKRREQRQGPPMDLISKLVKLGVAVNGRNESESCPIRFAAYTDSTGRCVNFLIDAGADVLCRNEHGDTPLHFAARGNNERNVLALMSAGASSKVHNDDGKTPLAVATTDTIRDILEN